MKKERAKKIVENFIRREVRKSLNESYGQELDKLQKAFDRCVNSMRGSSVMENGPFGIWVDLGLRNQFCDESGKPLKRIN